MEILRDILSNRLDIDCSRTSVQIAYTPGYFLGRHDVRNFYFYKMIDANDCFLAENGIAEPVFRGGG